MMILSFRPIRKIAKWFLIRSGIWQRIEDGTFLADPAIFIPNFIFQRILGVNRDCPWAVHYTSRVSHAKNIRLGRRVAVSFAVTGGVYIQAANGIVFGDDVIFAPGVKIISANHDPNDITQYLSDQPITIGDRCWIGANAIVLPGVTLGEGVVVGAGAVVTKSFPSNVIVIGNPARIIREIKKDEDLDLPQLATRYK